MDYRRLDWSTWGNIPGDSNLNRNRGHSRSELEHARPGRDEQIVQLPKSNSPLNRKSKVNMMATTHVQHEDQNVSRDDLISLLNEDLAGEYQAIISYVIYSKVIKGAQFMNIAAELEKHAAEELAHALIIAGQIDYLGGMPLAVPKPVKTSAKPEDMLRFDLDNENQTITRYRQRIRQCESLGEYAMAEQIRDILVQEQDHQIALATALGIEVPNVSQLGMNLPDNCS